MAQADDTQVVPADQTSVSILFERDNEDYPFEDDCGKFYPTLEHFYQANKFISTDPAFAEEIRLAKTADESKALAKSTEHPKVDNWPTTKTRVMEKAITLRITKNKSLESFIMNTTPETLMEQTTETQLVGILTRIREQLIQQKQGYTLVPLTRKQKKNTKRKKKKKNIYKLQDGSAAFDMVSSDSVKISVTAEEIVIPMKALPSRAKTAAKDYQYYKKNHPETIHEEDDEDSDDDFQDIDSDCEEFIFHRENTSTNVEEDSFARDLLTLIELGYTDTEANYAAMISAEGNLELALDFLA